MLTPSPGQYLPFLLEQRPYFLAYEARTPREGSYTQPLSLPVEARQTLAAMFSTTAPFDLQCEGLLEFVVRFLRRTGTYVQKQKARRVRGVSPGAEWPAVEGRQGTMVETVPQMVKRRGRPGRGRFVTHFAGLELEMDSAVFVLGAVAYNPAAHRRHPRLKIRRRLR